MTNYTLIIRTWFGNGRTYFTMRIVKPDQNEIVIPFTYGHGHATFLGAARDALGIGRDDPSVSYLIDEVSVARRKDLHCEGRSFARARV